jgi:putative peptidoglycan lipid II flippase
LTFFTTPVTTVLFPTFSKINPKKDHKLLKIVFASSVKYAALLLVPATMALMVLSQPIISALFQNRYFYAPMFLTLYIIGDLFAALGVMSENSLLSGIGETRFQMKQSLLKLVLGIPLAVLLISAFGILGLIASYILAGLPSFFWGLYWIWKNCKVKANYKSVLRVFAAATVAAVVTFLSLTLLNATSWIGLAIGGIVFVGCYLFALPMLEVEIQNLRSMFSGLGLITKLLNIPLNLLEKILVFHQTQAKHGQAKRRDVSSK